MLTIQENIRQAREALQEAGSQAGPDHAGPRVDLLWSALDKLTVAVEQLTNQWRKGQV